MLPSPTQDVGPRRLARPFSYGSFIHTSQPVLTGAFPVPFSCPVLPRTVAEREPALATLEVTDDGPLTVSRFTPTLSRFCAEFSRDLDRSVLNL